MSILQFLRILQAYRRLVLASALVFLVAAILFVQLVKPRYEAQSRVMLDIIKPDPVTGQMIATAFLRAYTKTQIELVKDTQIARATVEKLGWEQNPEMLRIYRESADEGQVDFKTWAGEYISDGADAKLIQGSNILEISYSSSSPQRAKEVADALRSVYIETTLETRREAARRNAEWYEEQAGKVRGILLQAEAEKAKFERENGIILGHDKVDIDSARLAALAASAGAPPMIAGGQVGSPEMAAQLAQIESELLTASKVLGPNHPQLLDLRRRREVIAAQVAEQRRAASNSAAMAASAAQATGGLLEAQKAKVMAQREKVEQLRLIQDEIDLRRDQYNKALARAAQLRQEAEIAEAGVVPLANAVTPQSPVFPKKGLIIGAAMPGGVGLGLLAALLLEIFRRRVRSSEDLAHAVRAPVLAVIRGPKPPKPSIRDWLPRFGGGRSSERAARA